MIRWIYLFYFLPTLFKKFGHTFSMKVDDQVCSMEQNRKGRMTIFLKVIIIEKPPVSPIYPVKKTTAFESHSW